MKFPFHGWTLEGKLLTPRQMREMDAERQLYLRWRKR